MAWPPYVAVTLNVVPAAPDPSSTHTVANATVFDPPAVRLMGALRDDSPNAATTVFVLLNVTAADIASEDVVCARETEPMAVTAIARIVRMRFIVWYGSRFRTP